MMLQAPCCFLKKSDESPVIFYKPQGLNSNILEDDGFMLCLQTNTQAMMMSEFGENVICIDSTHKTTGYDFVLVTLLIVNDLLEA
jgi:hypothetical protein